MAGKLQGKVALITGASSLTEHIPDPETKKEVEEWIASMRLLQSKDIAAAILYAVTQPSYVDVNEILIRPRDEL